MIYLHCSPLHGQIKATDRAIYAIMFCSHWVFHSGWLDVCNCNCTALRLFITDNPTLRSNIFVKLVEQAWASPIQMHVFKVEFCLYGTYTYVRRSVCHGWLSWTPIVLLHSASFIEQVCSTVRPHLSDTDRGRGKGWPQRLWMNELLHCAA